MINYIHNRFFDRTHLLPTGLAPGKFYELDTRILHGCFNNLEKFIEQELAWDWYIWNTDFNTFGSKFKHFCKVTFPWFFKITYREIEGAKDHVRRNMLDVRSNGKTVGNIVLELYDWWKYDRPNREDPWNVTQSLWDAYDLDAEHYREDMDNLKKLIDIMDCLWT